MRELLAARPLRAFERAMPEDRPELAERVMTAGWRMASHPPISLAPPVAWDEVASSNRSWHYHLHAWDGLGGVLAAHDDSGEERHLRFAAATALDWAAAFPTPATPSPFAWYDMAVGLRAYRLGYLLDALARTDLLDGEGFGALVGSAFVHLDALADEAQFAGHSNHGFYQAVGQTALGRRLAGTPRGDEALAQGRRRLREMILRQFNAEGVHLEHSPGYHLLVLNGVGRALASGLIEDPEIEALYDRAEAALAWFVMPDGTFAMFGDTPRNARLEGLLGRASELVHVRTRGREGRAPREVTQVFRESGYVVLRDRWAEPPEDASYLAQTAAFHSKVHRHADDLSFVWYDRGRQLLVDAGRFGYLGKVGRGKDRAGLGFTYSDPRRMYVESTRAHNTVEVDGRSNRRRGIPPYGSALGRVGDADGVRIVESAVRLGRVRFTRVLLWRPRRWLVVLDRLRDPAWRRHDYVQRFHLAPGLELERLGDGYAVDLDGEDVRLHVAPLLPAVPLEPIRGQTEPEIAGFMSPAGGQLEPNWTLGFRADRGRARNFATVLAFSVEPPSPLSAAGGLAWMDDTRHVLRFRRAGDASLDLAYREDDR